MEMSKQRNLIKIKHDFKIDQLFAEGKITLEEFLKKRSLGPYERWNEMSYIAAHPFLLRSFLLKLPVELRLQAIRSLYGYTSKYHEKLGEFGGSLSNHFKYDVGLDRKIEYTTLKARIAVSLDIPLVYVLKDQPTKYELEHYDFVEYFEIGEEISLVDLKSIISRPSERRISCYIIKMDIPSFGLLPYSSDYLFCRVDLHKTFFVVEFYLQKYTNTDIASIFKLVGYFDNVCRVVVSTPLLRDSRKLSIIGTYIAEQQAEAIKYSDYLIRSWSGEQLYPYEINFEDNIPIEGFR